MTQDGQAIDDPDDDWDEDEPWPNDQSKGTGSEGTALDELLDATVAITDPRAGALLRNGAIEVHGRMPWSSNGTYLCSVDDGRGRIQAIYKPEAGERPLWDFPRGLWKREVAMFELGDALGWPVVPPTVIRRDGPMGIGSLQGYAPSRYEEHYFTFRDRTDLLRGLEQICVLDLIANNTDRKGGHVLLGFDGRPWAIDNGLAFHVEFKLRTVLWDFAGTPIAAEMAEAVGALVERGLPSCFDELLDEDEREAVRQRANSVLAAGVFPSDPSGRRYPWPLV